MASLIAVIVTSIGQLITGIGTLIPFGKVTGVGKLLLISNQSCLSYVLSTLKSSGWMFKVTNKESKNQIQYTIDKE